NRKTKNAVDGHREKPIEKTVLRLLGSHTFSHSLDPLRSLACVGRDARPLPPELTLLRARAIVERRHSKTWPSLRNYGALSSWRLRYSKFASLVDQLERAEYSLVFRRRRHRR